MGMFFTSTVPINVAKKKNPCMGSGDNTMIKMENSRSDSDVHTATTDERRGGPLNVENSKIFCRFFPSGGFSSDRQQYSGPLLWDLGVTSLVMIRVPLNETRRTPSGDP